MKRVEEDGMWSLMCPHICPGLSDCWGEKFEELYTRYEREGKFMKQVRLLFGMVTSSHWIIFKFAPLFHCQFENISFSRSKLSNFGMPSLSLRSKQELHICCIKMPATVSPTNKI